MRIRPATLLLFAALPAQASAGAEAKGSDAILQAKHGRLAFSSPAFPTASPPFDATHAGGARRTAGAHRLYMAAGGKGQKEDVPVARMIFLALSRLQALQQLSTGQASGGKFADTAPGGQTTAPPSPLDDGADGDEWFLSPHNTRRDHAVEGSGVLLRKLVAAPDAGAVEEDRPHGGVLTQPGTAGARTSTFSLASCSLAQNRDLSWAT
jgi:hypothetical protein